MLSTHQHIEFQALLAADFQQSDTSSVLKNVTIGLGACIHISKA